MEASNLYYGYIYKITIPTSEGICYCWGQHKYSNYPNIDLKYWGSGTKLTNWIKKHLGKQKRPGRLDPNLAIQIGLKREILGWYKSLEELNKAELKIVNEHIEENNCWNIHPGGEGGSHKQSLETRLKISKANKGKKNPWLKEYNKTHLSERNKKYKNTLGKTRWTNGIKEKFSKVCPGEGWIKGRLPEILCKWWNNGKKEVYTKECPDGFVRGRLNSVTPRKKVKCIELNIIFESIQKATEYFKASHSHISDCCNKKRNTYKGYHWEYVDD